MSEVMHAFFATSSFALFSHIFEGNQFNRDEKTSIPTLFALAFFGFGFTVLFAITLLSPWMPLLLTGSPGRYPRDAGLAGSFSFLVKMTGALFLGYLSYIGRDLIVLLSRALIVTLLEDL